MSQKFEFEYYDDEDIVRGRKLNKNQRRAERQSRNNDRYASYESYDNAGDEVGFAY